MSDPEKKIALRAVGLSKSFSIVGSSKLHVLDGVELELEETSSLSIRGDSGCGKTTLLNLLARLEPADNGILYWGDKKIDASCKPNSQEASWRSKHIGVVYQSYYLIPELTVMENVLMSVRLSKLSGGERQRVAIARALVNRPKVILADEPTGNLDERTGGEVMDLLLSTCSIEGTSLILVTHNPSFAKATQKSSVLKDGKLVYV